MSAHDYWNNGQGQQHNQQKEYNQGQHGSGQSNPADPYGYLSGGQPTQQYGYNDRHSPAPYQQQPQSYNYNEGQDPAPYPQQQYQSYSQQNSYTHTSLYQPPPPQPYQQLSPQPYQAQMNDGRHSPQPPAYDQTRQQGYDAYSQQGFNAQITSAQPADGDRGILGAVGGAAAGGFAGHKVNHGFIGALGGAYAGHKLEDAVKDKKKAKKNKLGRRNSNSSSSSSSSSSSDDENKKKKKYGAGAAAAAGGGAYMHHQNQQQHHQPSREVLAGNFSSSCTNITIDRDYDLIASCNAMGGHQKLSSISLNDHLTNEWGQLKWLRGGGFGGSSRDVRLVDNGRVLEAELGDGRGGWSRSHIRLDERITNSDGELQYVG